MKKVETKTYNSSCYKVPN